MTRFGYTILYVRDVEATLHFYEKAFGLQRKFIAPDQSYGELLTGDTTLSFASVTLAASNLKNGFIPSEPAQKPFAMEIGMVTDDVPGTLETALSAGASLVENPKTKPWGQVVAYVRDPEGFLVEICSPVN